MLRHAACQGAQVLEETKVTEIEFGKSGGDTYPRAALWTNKKGETGKISFDYVIDASGRAGVLSVKYLHNRNFNQDLKNVAVWSYWKGAKTYLPDTPREGSPFFESLGGMSAVENYIDTRSFLASNR
jgi:flavine halogenase